MAAIEQDIAGSGGSLQWQQLSNTLVVMVGVGSGSN